MLNGVPLLNLTLVLIMYYYFVQQTEEFIFEQTSLCSLCIQSSITFKCHLSVSSVILLGIFRFHAHMPQKMYEMAFFCTINSEKTEAEQVDVVGLFLFV